MRLIKWLLPFLFCVSIMAQPPSSELLVVVHSLTSAQLDTLNADPGALAFNSDQKSLQVYDGAQWNSSNMPEVKTQTLTIPANATIVTSAKAQNFINAWALIPGNANKISAIGTIDPTNVSTGDANLINDIYDDLTYNNSSAGSRNKALPAIDIGTAQAIGTVDVYWWNNTYTATNYSIQGSTNGTNWTTLASGLNSSGIVGSSQNPQKVQVSGSYRYIRVFCTTGSNSTWVVISELEVFSPSNTTITEYISSRDDILVGINNGSVEIANRNDFAVEAIVHYLDIE